MGMRSQIYITAGFSIIKAAHYQWLYGIDIIAIAKQVVKEAREYGYVIDDTEDEKLRLLASVNFDSKKVFPNEDILTEALNVTRLTSQRDKFNEKLFVKQDNDFGQLYIDFKPGSFEKPSRVKYCFVLGVGDENAQPLSVEEYAEATWKEAYCKKLFDNEQKFFEKNCRYLNRNADVMTQKELQDVLTRDYYYTFEELPFF